MVVVIGAGIAGAAFSYYYLSMQGKPSDLTLVDAVGPAACSSGTAGAYLSSGWGDQTKREALFRKSFALHEQLAKDLNLQSFQYLPSFRVERNQNDDGSDSRTNDDKESKDASLPNLQWMKQNYSFQPIPGRAATVDPYELTNCLVDNVVKQGASLLINSVDGFAIDDETKEVSAVRFVDGSCLQIDENEPVVVAMGPWSSRIEDWCNIPLPIDGVLSTSILWRHGSYP